MRKSEKDTGAASFVNPPRMLRVMIGKSTQLQNPSAGYGNHRQREASLQWLPRHSLRLFLCDDGYMHAA